MLRLCCLVFVLQNLLLAVHCADRYSRNDFPPGFIFGSGSSAYQVEGAVAEDGRTPSIWDTFTHSGKWRGATGDVASDEYHKYKEDVQLMAQTGLDAYRFSISWSRLIPYGRGPVNPKGLEYYNNLINELISHGIQPHVTLYNFDLPQALEDEYGGWLSQKIVKDFHAYADVCFREFGDRVSFWATVNEPNAMAIGGYDQGFVPPARCSSPYGVDCTKGNSSSEPYIVIRHVLLAHASAVKLYRKKYKGKQHGLIGLSIYSFGFVPLTNSTEDVIATRRATDFVVGCIAHPLVFGDYPDVMKKNVGSRLLPFSNRESKLIKGSFDFIGVMHYFPVHIKNNPSILESEDRDFNADMGASLILKPESASANELPVAPWVMQDVLEHFKDAYGNPPVYVFENGKRTQRNSSLRDISRVEYMHAYIGSVLDVVRNGSNTRGYFAWSFLDLFELDGCESSYGLYYVDLDDPDLRRYPKLSANWYSDFLKGGHFSTDGVLKLREPPSALSKNRLFQ